MHKVSEPTSSLRDVYVPAARKPGRKRFIIPAALLVILVIIFLLLRPFLFEEIVVAEPKPIAVIAFNNQTGNASYNYLREAIPNLLITSLEQSKYLRVMTWERMNDVLKQMGKGSVGVMSKELGFELCQHEGISAIIIGSYIKAGNTFVTDVKVLDVNTKELLKSVSVKGEGVQSILNTQIDQLSKEIASGVGLSKKKIESTPTQIKEVTTSSMDAYNFFLRGREEYEKLYFEESLRFLNNAVAIDSSFALAYLYIARSYSNLLDVSSMAKAIGKAKILSSRAPEKERLAIESLYAGMIEKNYTKQLTLLEKLVEKYPREKRFHNDLGVIYQSRNNFKEAQTEFERAIQLDPDFASPINGLAYIYAAQGLYVKAIETQKRYAALSPGDANPFDSMGEIYFLMGNIPESIAKYREALKIQPSFFTSYASLGYVYAFNENFNDSFKCFDNFFAAASTKGMKVWVMTWKSILLNWVGRTREAARENDLIVSLFNQEKNNAMSAQYHWAKACNALNNNNFILSRNEFEAFYKYYNLDHPQNPLFNKTLLNCFITYILLKQGKLDSARSYLIEVKANQSSFELNNSILVMLSNIVESELLLAEKRPDDAIRVYRNTQLIFANFSYAWEIRFYNFPPFRDIVPRAFMQKKDLDSAIIEYEKLLKRDQNSKDRRLINPIYHYRLAKLCENAGKYEKAKAEYSRFIELWKNADKDQPMLIDAKKRLVSMK